jgi:hypothetical protein
MHVSVLNYNMVFNTRYGDHMLPQKRVQCRLQYTIYFKTSFLISRGCVLGTSSFKLFDQYTSWGAVKKKISCFSWLSCLNMYMLHGEEPAFKSNKRHKYDILRLLWMGTLLPAHCYFIDNLILR